MKTFVLEIKKYPRYKVFLYRALISAGVILAVVFLYLGFAFFVLFLLPILAAYVFVRYQLFKRKLSKAFRQISPK